MILQQKQAKLSIKTNIMPIVDNNLRHDRTQKYFWGVSNCKNY